MSPALTLLLLACAPDAPSPETDAGDDLPSEYIYDEEAAPVAEVDAATVEASLQLVLDGVYSYVDTDPLFAAYDRAMSGQSGSCPAWYNDGDAVFWYDECTSDLGNSYSGYGYELSYENYEEGGYVYNGRALYAAFTIDTSEGYRFDGAGLAYALSYSTDTDTVAYKVVQGTFRWDGPEAAGSWMDVGLSPDLTLATYTTLNAPGGVYIYADGGVSPLDGAMVAASFADVFIISEEFGSNCSAEPSGTISLRTADGAWYDVLFDGPTESAMIVDEADCDGCGSVWYLGEHVGDACVDFSSFSDWR